MAYSAQVLNVMIAGPSDVCEERRAVREAIFQWNTVHSESLKTVLMPRMWESDAVPDSGGHPQSFVNRQVLEHADLLIAVFWTKIGTPTNRWASGTVEEIEKHIQAGKPAMVYFSSRPISPDEIDDGQYSALKSFKESMRTRSLYCDFADLAAFRLRIDQQLALKIHEILGAGRTTADVESRPGLRPRRQLGRLAEELLREGSESDQGVIQNVEGSLLTPSSDARTIAQRRSALTELKRLGLVEDRAGRGELFFLTGEGYTIAEGLKARA